MRSIARTIIVTFLFFAMANVAVAQESSKEALPNSEQTTTSDSTMTDSAGSDTTKPPSDVSEIPTIAPVMGGSIPTPAASNEAIPTNLRLRRLEQRVQALKERAWRAKARVGMIKEAVLGGGVGSQASITHENNMGKSFRLVKIIYALDGKPIYSTNNKLIPELWKMKKLDILTGPLSPGSHTLSVMAVYQGYGYGLFKYLEEYKYTVRSSHTFAVADGKTTVVVAKAFEKGRGTTPMKDRPAIEFKVNHVSGIVLKEAK